MCEHDCNIEVRSGYIYCGIQEAKVNAEMAIKILLKIKIPGLLLSTKWEEETQMHKTL